MLTFLPSSVYLPSSAHPHAATPKQLERLEEIQKKFEDALEDLKKFKADQSSSKETEVDKSQSQESKTAQYISIVILSALLLPGLLPLYISTHTGPGHVLSHHLSSWMIGVGKGPGQILWTILTVLSVFALGFGGIVSLAALVFTAFGM